MQYVCVFVCLFLYCGRSHRLGRIVVCLLVAFSPPVPLPNHRLPLPLHFLPTLHPFRPGSELPGCTERGRVKEAPSREAGTSAGPLSGAGMQKMWKQLGSESWCFQSPEVTKGFHPGSEGRGGRRWAADGNGRL